jgi:hypothetical protein
MSFKYDPPVLGHLYMQVYYWLKDFWNPYLGKYLNFQASDSVEYCLKAFHWIFCLFIILTRLQTAFYMSSFWHLTFRANFGVCKVAPKLANEQAGQSQESRLFRRSWFQDLSQLIVSVHCRSTIRHVESYNIVDIDISWRYRHILRKEWKIAGTTTNEILIISRNSVLVNTQNIGSRRRKRKWRFKQAKDCLRRQRMFHSGSVH